MEKNMTYCVKLDADYDRDLILNALKNDETGWFMKSYLTTDKGRKEFVSYHVMMKLDELNKKCDFGGWLEDQLDGESFYSLTEALDFLEDRWEDAMEFAGYAID